LWSDELDDTGLAQMSGAYVRRKQWEARVLAIAVVNALGESMNQDGAQGKQRVDLLEFERIAKG